MRWCRCWRSAFTPKGGEDPGGVIELVLAGGGAIRLDGGMHRRRTGRSHRPLGGARPRPIMRRALMARRLNAKDANFAADFEALLFAKREVEEDVAAEVARHHRRCARARRCGAGGADQQIRPRQCHRGDAETVRRGDRRRAAARSRQAQAAAIETAAARIEAYHRRQLPQDDTLHRRHRRRAGLALDQRGQRRALCAGRHRGLSVLGADERHSGQGRGRARAS